MNLKERIADSIERKLGLKYSGLTSSYSLYNTLLAESVKHYDKEDADYK